MRRSTAFTLLPILAVTLIVLCPLTFAQQQQANTRQVVDRVVPSYPELAKRMNLEGRVKLQVTVSTNGAPKSIQAVGGNPILVKAAQDAIYKWKWAPAPQETKELVELRFHPQ